MYSSVMKDPCGEKKPSFCTTNMSFVGRAPRFELRPRRSQSDLFSRARLIQKAWRKLSRRRQYDHFQDSLAETKLLFTTRQQNIELHAAARGTDDGNRLLEETQAARVLGYTQEERLRSVEIVLQMVVECDETKRVEAFERRRLEKSVSFKAKSNQSALHWAARYVQACWRQNRLRRMLPKQPSFRAKHKPIIRVASAMHVPSVQAVAARAAVRAVIERAVLAEDWFAEVATGTSEDGCELLIDEGDTLLDLCMRTLLQSSGTRAPPDAAQMRACLARRRAQPGASLRLDFDEFVDVYNNLVLPAMRSGR